MLWRFTNFFCSTILDGNAEYSWTKIGMNGRFISHSPAAEHIHRNLDDPKFSQTVMEGIYTLDRLRVQQFQTSTKIVSYHYWSREDTALNCRRIWSSSGENVHPRDFALGAVNSLVNAVKASLMSFGSNIHAILNAVNLAEISSHTLQLTQSHFKIRTQIHSHLSIQKSNWGVQ